MWWTFASARWRWLALASALVLGIAVLCGAAQRDTILTNGRNLQIPINHGLPDKPLGFTFCRLRYDNIRRARKSGWGDDYPQADYNFMVRLSELTTAPISRWNNGYPGFANVTPMDPDLFQCPYLRMQNAANYDFTPEETARMHDYFLKGGFLWIDDNWDPDFEYIRPNLARILPGAPIIDLPLEHPMFSNVYHINPLPQIPSLGSWQRTGQNSEIGPSTVHYYGMFADHLGISRQRDADLCSVGLSVPVGRITSQQLSDVARLARVYGTGDVRITTGQNVIIANVPHVKIPALSAEPLVRDLPHEPSGMMRGLVSCTGIDYCHMALIETKELALKTARELEEKFGQNKKMLTMHWSGCPAGCGNHAAADIGLLGKSVKIGDQVVDAVDVFVGGRSGPNAKPGTKVLEDVPCRDLANVLEQVLPYLSNKRPVKALARVKAADATVRV